MATGMKVWDLAGNLIVDLTTRLSRIVAIVDIPVGGSGSHQVDLSLGQPWAWPQPTGSSGYGPIVSISGDTVTWAPNPTYPGGAQAVKLIIGVR